MCEMLKGKGAFIRFGWKKYMLRLFSVQLV